MLKYGIFSCLLLGAAGSLLTASCDQPPAVCTFAIGDSYSTLYEKLSEATCDIDDAAHQATKEALNKIEWEIIGASSYYPINPDIGVPDLTKGARFALQGGALGKRRAAGESPITDERCTNTFTEEPPDTANVIYSTGKFTADNAPDGTFCPAVAETSGRQDLVGFKQVLLNDDGNPTNAATNVEIPKPKTGEPKPTPVLCVEQTVPPITASYTWTDLRVLSSAAYQGIEFSGTLDYARNGCKIKLKARGLYPVQTCQNYRTRRDATGAAVKDKDGNPIIDPVERPEETCYPLPDKGRVNPDVATRCYFGPGVTTPPPNSDGYCVLAKELPSLR